jgi:hypothetical protein
MILVSIILGTAQLVLLSKHTQQRYRDHLKTMSIISDHSELFRGLPFQSSELDPGKSSQEFLDPESGRIYVLEWEIEDISSSMKSVHISCHPVGYRDRISQATLWLSQELGF